MKHQVKEHHAKHHARALARGYEEATRAGAAGAAWRGGGSPPAELEELKTLSEAHVHELKNGLQDFEYSMEDEIVSVPFHEYRLLVVNREVLMLFHPG